MAQYYEESGNGDPLWRTAIGRLSVLSCPLERSGEQESYHFTLCTVTNRVVFVIITILKVEKVLAAERGDINASDQRYL